MPHDSEQEEVSQEKLFKRLMETSEADLPPIPDPAPASSSVSGEPGRPPSDEVAAQSQGDQARSEQDRAESGDPIERLLTVAEEILSNQVQFNAELQSFMDTVEAALQGD